MNPVTRSQTGTDDEGGSKCVTIQVERPEKGGQMYSSDTNGSKDGSHDLKKAGRFIPFWYSFGFLAPGQI